MSNDSRIEKLDAGLLARTQVEKEWTHTLREDMEDCLKEYSQLDLVVEILQNALDAIDYKRYKLICQAAGRDPEAQDTVTDWNEAVLECIQSDYEIYSAAREPVDRAQVYKAFSDDRRRREQWWTVLSKHLGGTEADLAASTQDYVPELTITVDLDSPRWLEVEDNGVGMEDIVNSFRHKVSTKRRYRKEQRRLGLRGSHGWGLTSILAMSDSVEVLSRVKVNEPEAYAFSKYAAFCNGMVDKPVNERIKLDSDRASKLSPRLRTQQDESGTHIRVQIDELDPTNPLGHTLEHYDHEKFCNLLRLYTPIGQVNDFLLHPAYHNVRRDDITITLKSLIDGKVKQSPVPFDVFRLSEQSGVPYYTFSDFLNEGWPSNVSVHTVHRSHRGESVHLSAAEIQSAKEVVSKLEERLIDQNVLPGYIDESDREIMEIPRGFYLALSGGMKAELLVRQPRSTSAAFRGFVLSETARPTLGRKHVMDQRRSIPKAALSHEQTYDDARKAVLPKAVAPVFSPAGARWRRQFFETVIQDTSSQEPLSSSLRVWAGSESYEARVMLVFAELLQRGVFGDFRILRAHLKDRYDFAFLYRCEAGLDHTPNVATLERLYRSGYGEWESGRRDRFHRYGLGEFKASGEDILPDFDPDDPRKAAEAIDLVVCWSFDHDAVGDVGWLVESSTPVSREFEGQTHLWRPTGPDIGRTRGLPVVSLQKLIPYLVDSGELEDAPKPWPDILPENYF